MSVPRARRQFAKRKSTVRRFNFASAQEPLPQFWRFSVAVDVATTSSKPAIVAAPQIARATLRSCAPRSAAANPRPPSPHRPRSRLELPEVQREARPQASARRYQVPATPGVPRTRLAERKSKTNPHALPQRRPELVSNRGKTRTCPRTANPRYVSPAPTARTNPPGFIPQPGSQIVAASIP